MLLGPTKSLETSNGIGLLSEQQGQDPEEGDEPWLGGADPFLHSLGSQSHKYHSALPWDSHGHIIICSRTSKMPSSSVPKLGQKQESPRQALSPFVTKGLFPRPLQLVPPHLYFMQQFR